LVGGLVSPDQPPEYRAGVRAAVARLTDLAHGVEEGAPGEEEPLSPE
jgi:hypothetical protein